MTDDPQPDHYAPLRARIEALWEERETLSPLTGGEDRLAIETALNELDLGRLRVAERQRSHAFGHPPAAGQTPAHPGAPSLEHDDEAGHADTEREEAWLVNVWLKQAVLMSFRLTSSTLTPGAGGAPVFDKVPMKFHHWGANRFKEADFRVVPGAIVRRSAYVAPGVVLMPCFVNVGAYIDRGTMVDTWATIGSCAQIGRNCHISGGAGIGGVLEPLQSGPVIIEDDCFIGARSEVAEGVVVGRGSVISMGVFLGASTKIIDRDTGEIHVGRVPPFSVVVPGALPGRPLRDGSPGPSLGCAVIVKRVDAQTRAKTSINELLRD